MSAERRKRLLDDARDPVAFLKLGKDLVRAPRRPLPRVRDTPSGKDGAGWVALTLVWQPFGGQDFEEILQSMSSDDCLRVWDALAQHIAPDFDAESKVRCHMRAPAVACACDCGPFRAWSVLADPAVRHARPAMCVSGDA
jgi:hypothetical protein